MIENTGQAPVWILAAIVFAITIFLASCVYAMVFKLDKIFSVEISPGFFTPMSATFGLIIGFLASQVWSDNSRAISAVMREASALKTIVTISDIFPAPTKKILEASAINYIDHSVNTEWPAMQQARSYNGLADDGNNEGLKFVILITPQNETEASAKQQLLKSYSTLYEARSERLFLSGTSVNPLKWFIVTTFAVLLMFITVLIHRADRKSARCALALLCCAITLSYVLILAHDRPFTGFVAIKPDLLLNAKPAQ